MVSHSEAPLIPSREVVSVERDGGTYGNKEIRRRQRVGNVKRVRDLEKDESSHHHGCRESGRGARFANAPERDGGSEEVRSHSRDSVGVVDGCSSRAGRGDTGRGRGERRRRKKEDGGRALWSRDLSSKMKCDSTTGWITRLPSSTSSIPHTRDQSGGASGNEVSQRNIVQSQAAAQSKEKQSQVLEMEKEEQKKEAERRRKEEEEEESRREEERKRVEEQQKRAEKERAHREALERYHETCRSYISVVCLYLTNIEAHAHRFIVLLFSSLDMEFTP